MLKKVARGVLVFLREISPVLFAYGGLAVTATILWWLFRD